MRRAVLDSFAATGRPGEHGDLASLAAQHVVVLDDHGRILMAHPFAAHRDGARVNARGRTWWGNCAWDAFGIVAALELDDATVTAQGVEVTFERGEPQPADAVFHVLVPARHWWDDIAFT